MRTTEGAPKPKNIHILLDSGSSGTLIHAKNVKKLRKKPSKSTTWKTAAGKFNTAQKTQVEFILPELHKQWVINYKVYITAQKWAMI